MLEGVATIAIRATQDLSRFNLDLDGLTVRGVTIDGEPVEVRPKRRRAEDHPGGRHHRRAGRRGRGELRRCAGAPLLRPGVGCGGFIRTDDGVLVAGQPHVAATWFPVNDHPRDRAGSSFAVTVPDGLEVVANGALESHETDAGETRWVWEAPTPMASYLATVNVGPVRPDRVPRPSVADPTASTTSTPSTPT